MGGYGIVLADDHVLFRQGLRTILRGVGDLEVVGEAGDGRELLTPLGRRGPRHGHPRHLHAASSGIEVIGQVKRNRPEAKVLILSMHKEYLYRALSAGADGYL